MAEVRFAGRALRSLRGIERYLGERNPAEAERVVEEIRRACALIGDDPQMGPAIPGTRLRRHVTRRYRYRVIYRIVGEVVEVREVMLPSVQHLVEPLLIAHYIGPAISVSRPMPLPTRNAVRRAGKNAASAGAIHAVQRDDLFVLDEWRKAHLRPLSAVAMWLRKPSLDYTELAPAQRLKRRDTFLDKLITGRAKDASTMHDLGGCRLIFPDLDTLSKFRRYLEVESRARHKRLHEPTKYDYISQPKPTGYRGVHYVYGYSPSSNERSDLEGLKIEVQLRTTVQHAWATAVEIADLVSQTRTKFEDGTSEYGQFFRLASELLARSHEGTNSCLPDMGSRQLVSEFKRLENRIKLLDRLSALKEQGDISKIKQHTVLAFGFDNTVEIYGYTKAARAVEKEKELLEDSDCANVVYVSASTPRSIRSSYRNYLTNPEDFVELLYNALDRV